MKTNKNTEKNLTKTELDLLKKIATETLKSLETPRKKTTEELLDSYSKVLDLSGNSAWLAEEVLREDILKANELQDLFSNSLYLIKVIYQDGIESCEKLLGDFAVRGLWDSIRERKELLVSTLSKVDTQLELLEEKFTEGLGFGLPEFPKDKTVFQEFTPRKIEELVQGTQVTFEDLDLAIYTLRDLGYEVGYTKEGFLYLHTLLDDEYLSPEELVKVAKEEYKAAEEDDSYLE